MIQHHVNQLKGMYHHVASNMSTVIHAVPENGVSGLALYYGKFELDAMSVQKEVVEALCSVPQ